MQVLLLALIYFFHENHFSTLKWVPPTTDHSFDILKNQIKRQGQQNKTSNNKKRKLSTKFTIHLEEGNRQTEQESEKQYQFIYTAELCEEKDFENVSIPHLSVQNKLEAQVSLYRSHDINKSS